MAKRKVKTNLDILVYPIKNLLPLMVGLWVSNQIFGFALAVLFVLLNKWFNWGLNGHEDIFWGRHFSASLFLLTITLLFGRFLRITHVSFRRIWGTYKIGLIWALRSISVGALLSIARTAMNQQLFGIIEAPFDQQLHTNWALPLFVELILLSVAVPVVEEVLFRGLLYRSLEAVLSPWRAYVASSLLFTVYHVPSLYNLPINIVFLFILGLATAIFLRGSRSLTSSVIIHMMYNVVAILIRYRDIILP